MKIVFISNWFSEKMGYAENLFPKAMAKLGHEVHVITSTAQVYFNNQKYNSIYLKHLGPNIVEKTTKDINGFKLHRLDFVEERGFPFLPHKLNGIKFIGVDKLLDEIMPDVIQSFMHDDVTTFQVAKWAENNKIKFFTESHVHASVIRNNNKRGVVEILKSFLYKFNPELKFINKTTKTCFAISEDCAEIVSSLYHLEKDKIKIEPLGVDTDIFNYSNLEEINFERQNIRNELGFNENDIVCIYTGRFSHDKSPQTLASTIEYLQNNNFTNFKGLFLGNGNEEELNQLKSKKGNFVKGFVPMEQLPKYYWASDIGVWPREESTSQLDAAACGLPIILSNKIKVTERVEGNGLLYEEGNNLDLAEKILELKDPVKRHKFSQIGVSKILENFSWNSIAKKRFSDFNNL